MYHFRVLKEFTLKGQSFAGRSQIYSRPIRITDIDIALNIIDAFTGFSVGNAHEGAILLVIYIAIEELDTSCLTDGASPFQDQLEGDFRRPLSVVHAKGRTSTFRCLNILLLIFRVHSIG